MKQDLFNFLDSLKDSGNNSTSTKIAELKNYFNDFFKKFSSKNINRLNEISEKKIMEPLFVLNNPLKTKEVLKYLDKYPIIFKDNKYSNIIIILILYFNDEETNEIINACTSANPFISIPAIYKFSQICANLEISKSNLNEIIDFLKNPDIVSDLKVLFEGFNEDIHNIGMKLINALNRYRIESYYDVDKEIYDNLPRELKRVAKSDLLENNKREKELLTKALNDYFAFLNTRLKEIIEKYSKSEKERKRANKNIDELKRILDTSEEIKDIDIILRLCPNDETKSKVLDYIIFHNKKIYENLLQEYEKKRENNDENLKLLFTKYGFDYQKINEEEREKLKKLTYGEIENILSRLKKLSAFSVNASKVSIYNLTTIEDLIAKGLINTEWLNANINLFYENDNELAIVITNIDLLSKEGINMLQYSNSIDIIKSPLLKDNLYLLRLYGLIITKSTTNINFLSIADLRKRIEFVYSFEIDWNLNSLDILNYSIPELIKFKIANSLNIPFSNIDLDYQDLLYDFASSIIPLEITEKLNQESNFIVYLPIFLEKYQIDNQCLNINGVYVSIEKVKRNLAKIGNNDAESCLYAIIHHGFYTYEEIEVLNSTLIPEKTFISLVRR